MACFLYTAYTDVLFTQEDIYLASGSFYSRIKQYFNASDKMTKMEMYDGTVSLQYCIDFTINSAGNKSDLYYYMAPSRLMLHGVYAYEAGTANIDENHADHLEKDCVDSGDY
jgi:hypothetical protein